LYILQFDGLYREIPEHSGNGAHAGFMSYGWLIFKQEKFIARGLGVFARRNYAGSNIAEYLALIEGLDALADMKVEDAPIEIQGDAKCVLDQMAGLANVTSQSTRGLHQRAVKLTRPFAHLEWQWIPRRKNQAADKLSRQAIGHMWSIPGSYLGVLEAFTKPLNNRGARLWPVLDLRVFG
jgi:ribonuclease HI